MNLTMHETRFCISSYFLSQNMYLIQMYVLPNHFFEVSRFRLIWKMCKKKINKFHVEHPNCLYINIFKSLLNMCHCCTIWYTKIHGKTSMVAIMFAIAIGGLDSIHCRHRSTHDCFWVCQSSTVIQTYVILHVVHEQQALQFIEVWEGVLEATSMGNQAQPLPAIGSVYICKLVE